MYLDRSMLAKSLLYRLPFRRVDKLVQMALSLNISDNSQGKKVGKVNTLNHLDVQAHPILRISR